MDPIIHLGCRSCESELQVAADGAGELRCPQCGEAHRLRATPDVRSGARVDVCAVCGHGDFYIQKDFNRTLGLAIVGIGVLASLVFFARGAAILAMGALLGMALIDGAIYLLVGDATVCYACHAIYRGFGRNPEHRGFDLELLERYGGRDPRI